MTTRAIYWTCQVAGWGIYSAIGLYMATAQMGWQTSIVAGYILFFGYSIALTDLLRREIRRRQWLAAAGAAPFFKLAGSSILVGVIQTFLVTSISFAFGADKEFHLPLSVLLLGLNITAATSVWMIFYVALTAPRRAREKAVHLELALREAELRALEAQINPHFLFNCLNSIRGLVAENPPLAQDMITRLANILRYNLHRDPNHTVPLSSEVEIASDYLALEAVRFEDRLRVKMAIEPAASQAPVPPLLLQTLVENAIKHGLGKLPAGGDVHVRAALEGEALRLEVENTGALAPPEPGKIQVGLNNIRERLRLLYGERAALDLAQQNGRVTASVRIPRSS